MDRWVGSVRDLESQGDESHFFCLLHRPWAHNNPGQAAAALILVACRPHWLCRPSTWASAALPAAPSPTVLAPLLEMARRAADEGAAAAAAESCCRRGRKGAGVEASG